MDMVAHLSKKSSAQDSNTVGTSLNDDLEVLVGALPPYKTLFGKVGH